MFSVRRSTQETNISSRYMRGLVLTAACVAGASFSIQAAAAADTKSCAMNMFTVATIQMDENCLHGLNPLSDVYFERELNAWARRLVKSKT